MVYMKADEKRIVVALAGNPNSGKTTLFNNLTGSHQHVGNYGGVTVEVKEGGLRHGDWKIHVVDLPGTYSLLATSMDEEIARDFILFGQPDVTVVVVDSTRLERNLNLVLQVLEITDRVVVCLNLMDEAQRNGYEVDDRRLARDLGVPVVPTVARRNEGLEGLLQAISEVARGETVNRPYRMRSDLPELKGAINAMVEQIEKLYPDLPNSRWVALRLLDGDNSIAEALLKGELGNLMGSEDDEADQNLELQLEVVQ